MKYVVYVFLSFLLSLQIIDWLDGRPKSFKIHDVDLTENRLYLGDSTVYSLSGESAKLKDFGGDYSVLAFWAPWCKFCAAEFPHMDKISPALAKINVNVIPIVRSKEPQVDIEKFYKKLHLTNTSPVVSDDRDLYGKLQVKGYPMFFIVNSKWELIAKSRPNWDADYIEQLFKSLDEYVK